MMGPLSAVRMPPQSDDRAREPASDQDLWLPELVTRAAHGNRKALTALGTRLLPRVRNLVRYLIRGDQDVDDVAQEALVAVLRGLSSYRGLGTLESWTDRVAARATFSWLRRRRAQEQLRAARSDTERIVDGATLPDEALSRRRFVHLLDQLPWEQRHALVLRHVAGLSVAEIAEEAGAPLETVRTRLRLGRGRLRELGLDAEGQEDHD
jgi:RNA polymerase sigma-70 factor, ECF subfamily